MIFGKVTRFFFSVSTIACLLSSPLLAIVKEDQQISSSSSPQLEIIKEQQKEQIEILLKGRELVAEGYKEDPGFSIKTKVPKLWSLCDAQYNSIRKFLSQREGSEAFIEVLESFYHRQKANPKYKELSLLYYNWIVRGFSIIASCRNPKTAQAKVEKFEEELSQRKKFFNEQQRDGCRYINYDHRLETAKGAVLPFLVYTTDPHLIKNMTLLMQKDLLRGAHLLPFSIEIINEGMGFSAEGKPVGVYYIMPMEINPDLVELTPHLDHPELGMAQKLYFPSRRCGFVGDSRDARRFWRNAEAVRDIRGKIEGLGTDDEKRKAELALYDDFYEEPFIDFDKSKKDEGRDASYKFMKPVLQARIDKIKEQLRGKEPPLDVMLEINIRKAEKAGLSCEGATLKEKHKAYLTFLLNGYETLQKFMPNTL